MSELNLEQAKHYLEIFSNRLDKIRFEASAGYIYEKEMLQCDIKNLKEKIKILAEERIEEMGKI